MRKAALWPTTSAKRAAPWRETDCGAADLETVIQNLLSGEYGSPIRVIAFNTAERWSEDVSIYVDQELRRRSDLQMRDMPEGLQAFTDRYEGRYRDVQLPLPCAWRDPWPSIRLFLLAFGMAATFCTYAGC